MCAVKSQLRGIATTARVRRSLCVMNEFTNGHKLFSPLCPAVLVPVTMAQWTASIKHTAFQIPKADESPVLCSYLCYLSIDGVAKQTIISMNRVCVADGRLWSMGHEPRLGQERSQNLNPSKAKRIPAMRTTIQMMHLLNPRRQRKSRRHLFLAEANQRRRKRSNRQRSTISLSWRTSMPTR